MTVSLRHQDTEGIPKGANKDRNEKLHRCNRNRRKEKHGT